MVNVSGELAGDGERLEITSAGAQTLVRVVLPQGSTRDPGARLLVRVPRSSSLDVTTVSANIVVKEVGGVLRLKSVSADIEAAVAGTEAEMKTVSGDVTLTGSGAAAAVRVSTVSGDLRFTHGAGSLEITTVSGDVAAELRPLASLRARSTSGDLTLHGALARDARVEIETVSGDLRLDMAAEGGLAVDANSFSGDISTCFGAVAEKARSGRGRSLHATRGAGAAQLRFKSLSGDIAICDR
jgi:DUF4097 and DUF4098 domain-containing protein YvlB